VKSPGKTWFRLKKKREKKLLIARRKIRVRPDLETLAGGFCGMDRTASMRYTEGPESFTPERSTRGQP
jgi:hypothetical protein